jgi:hypothetical protein
MKDGLKPTFNPQERLWIRGAWQSSGGLWVSEFETETLGMEKQEDLLRGDVGKLRDLG